MFLLTHEESKLWRKLGRAALDNDLSVETARSQIPSDHLGMFCFFIGTLLAVKGRQEHGLDWLKAGTFYEGEGLFSNAHLTGYLSRHGNSLQMPCVCFEDPAPFVHFTTTPCLRHSRAEFVKFMAMTLPVFHAPVKIMDLGTGNGTLLADVLRRLLETGKVRGFEEVLLIDSSKAMLKLASEAVREVVPGARINVVHQRMQDAIGTISGHYDIAMSSLAYHHMPYETKLERLRELAPRLEHFILFELDANNDTPEQYSPELACSVYQSYGRIIDFIFSHDAPVETANHAVDHFLLTEELSFLTQPRGVRTDYHMLRGQWHDLFRRAFEGHLDFRAEATCYADLYLDLFAIHYGK